VLHQNPFTIPAENRDFTEWRRGRETYAVWVLPVREKAILEKFKAAREHLNGYLLEPYRRQPHITLFVCGFLVDEPKHNDDFTTTQLQLQMKALEQESIEPFEIEIGGLNSFASAPFLEVQDPTDSITRLRDILLRGGREFRTAPYTPHLTVGLYGGVFSSKDVTKRLSEFPFEPIKWIVTHVTLATYKASEIAGRLRYMNHFTLSQSSKA